MDQKSGDDAVISLGGVTGDVTIPDTATTYSLGADLDVSEGALGFKVTVTSSSGEGAAEIDLSFTGSASFGGDNPDFTRIGGTNTFADGETEKLITFRIEQDVLRESDERIFVDLTVTSADVQTRLSDGSQQIAIVDNDAPVIYSLGADQVVSEANGTFGVTITRSTDVGAAEISLGLSGATGDVTRIGGLNTFEDGETSKLIVFRIEQDALVEPDETVDFTLSLISAEQPGGVGDGTQTVTILYDDEATFGGGPIRGEVTPDLLRGTQQADLIIGGAGADTLRGGGGDTLKGGGGADTFQFRASDRNDTVADFR